MNTRRATAIALAATVTMVATMTALALQTFQTTNQTAVPPTNCNQAMPDAITFYSLPGPARHAVTTRDGCWIFARFQNSLADVGNGGIAVLRRAAGKLELARVFATVSDRELYGQGSGIALTRDDRTLIVGSGSHLLFLDVHAMTSTLSDPVLGRIGDAHFSAQPLGSGAIAVTSDNRFVFVKQHDTAWITLVDLELARSRGFNKSAIVGGFPTNPYPASIVLSRDERYLYVTQARAPVGLGAKMACRPSFGTGSEVFSQSVLSVLGARALLTAREPLEARVLGVGLTGCEAGSLALSADESTAYVTAHGDGTLLALDLRPAFNGSRPSIIGTVPVGKGPRDGVLTDQGRHLIVAHDSAEPGEIPHLTVIEAARVGEGARAVIGTIATKSGVRHMTVTPDGRTLLVSNFEAQSLQIVDIERAMPVAEQAKTR